MRTLLTLLGAALLAAWADAQQAGALLTAGERLKQLQANRTLVEKMVASGLALSTANDSVSRAAACRTAMGELALALDGAIDGKDPSRIAELGDHLTVLVSDGLIPAIADSHDVPAGSADEARLKEIHKQVSDEMARLELAVPRTDAVGRSTQVRATLERFTATRAKLAKLYSK
jgi:hypothetical protein